MTTEEFAPAKVNLALHVTGQRADGYHLLDSLVVFAAIGDRVAVQDGHGLRLTVAGPMAAALAGDDDNLVLRAARHLGIGDATITLTKMLPVASGIGGGSADAAATIRALCRLKGLRLPEPATTAALGADVPVCLAGRPARMSGIGEVLLPLPPLPEIWLVLVNPGVAVATAGVFGALTRRENPPLPELSSLSGVGALADHLRLCRNDLEAPARRLQPAIGDVLDALGAQPGCLLARMSGSGATCFGLFAGADDARAAAESVGAAWPDWWVAAARALS